MGAAPHLIFRQRRSLYGVKAAHVREITWLPELTPVEEMAAYVPGVFNLRGEIVPVIDLSILFEHGGARYNVSDALIVLESGSRLTGIIVNEVVDMLDLPAGTVQPLPEFGRVGMSHRRLVEGEAKADDELVMVIDLESLMYALPADGTAREPVGPAGGTFCMEASAEERKVFHSRAVNLGMIAADVEADGLAAVAVVVLNNESFGVNLDSVKEFLNITGLVPVPCCPRHILGSMNLRGNVLTIVDVRAALNMQSVSKAALKKAVVADAEGLTVGVAVEDVLKVIYVRGHEIKPSESVIQHDNGYIKGTIPYDGKMIAYIDIGKILSREDMIVNEEV